MCGYVLSTVNNDKTMMCLIP